MAASKVTGSKVARPLARVSRDLGAGRYPWQLHVAVASWALLAVTLLISRIGAPEAPDDSTLDDLRSTYDTPVVVPRAQDQWFVPWLPWLGVIVLIAAAVLFVGYGWARMGLAALGLVAVVGLASAAQWLAIPAAVFLVVGSVFGLLLPSHRYLNAARSGADGSGATGAADSTTVR